MDKLNFIQPGNNRESYRNISEINSIEEFNLNANENAPDVINTQSELLTEMYEGINLEESLPDENPEVMFAKYLWIIRLRVLDIEKIKTASEKLIKEIECWTKRRTEICQSTIDFLSQRMEGYLRQKELKSLHLPSGTIGLRKQQPKLEITDEVVFYEKADEELLRVIPETVEPNMKAIRERLKNTGNAPDGVNVTEQEPKFYYKLT